MPAAKEINQIAEDLGNKIQEKHLNDPYAYIKTDILEAFKKIFELTAFETMPSQS